MSRGRKIICVQNAVISAMLTEVIARVVYQSVTGWRLVVLFVAVFLMLYRTLADISTVIMKGGRHDKAAGAEGSRGTVPGVDWYKMRFRRVEQKNRHTAKDALQVQTESRQHPMRQVF